MRTLAFVAISLMFGLGTTVSAQQRLVSTQQTYVCPKCGKVHARSAPSTGIVSAGPSQTVAQTPSLPQTPAVAQTQPVSYIRPATGSTLSAAAIQTTVSVHPRVNEAPLAATSRLRAAAGVSNVLAALNAQRARQGVPTLRYDPQLQVVAQRRAQHMASIGLKNHPPGSFAPGRYEGVGWSSSYSPSGVSACFTSDARMRYAGAAMATGRDGVYFAVVYR